MEKRGKESRYREYSVEEGRVDNRVYMLYRHDTYLVEVALRSWRASPTRTPATISSMHLRGRGRGLERRGKKGERGGRKMERRGRGRGVERRGKGGERGGGGIERRGRGIKRRELRNEFYCE